jgi:hypothetical protein
VALYGGQRQTARTGEKDMFVEKGTAGGVNNFMQRIVDALFPQLNRVKFPRTDAWLSILKLVLMNLNH